MATKALTAAQIDSLAQCLSETPLKPTANARWARKGFARLLAARIGPERGEVAFTSILSAATFEQAEARLILVLNYGKTEPVEPNAPESLPGAPDETVSAAPVTGKRKAILDQAAAGVLPPVPDFSKPTHARFRNKLAQVVALAEAGDLAALQAFEINPVSSSPKAMARYRDLCVIAIGARERVTA